MFVVLFPANKSQANVLEQKKTYSLQSVLSSIDRTKEKKKRKHPNYKCYQILLSDSEVMAASSQSVLSTH